MNHENKNEKNGLFIPTRQVTAYASLSISILCAVFVSGYFLGKKQVVDQFVGNAEQDSFADQVYASLCNLYDANITPQEEIRSSVRLPVLEQEEPLTVTLENEKDAAVPTQLVARDAQEDATTARYYAQLIGYGTKKAADAFVQKLQKKDIPVVVKNRKSKTAQGRTITWYQVVTEPCTDREDLEALTQRIAHDENIKGIQIYSC